MSKNFALVFPGQGSQALGMMSKPAESHPLLREVFQQASDTLGMDLWALSQQGPEEQLNKTENTQPALLTAGFALWKLWKSLGGADPSAMAGHSLGEYTALVAAQAVSFEDALRLVRKRGELMQSAVPAGKGAMAAILGLDDDTIGEICRQSADNETVMPANFNAPGQVVVAGDKTAVDRAVALASEKGAKRCVVLPVSVPSHCLLMKPAAEQFQSLLEETAFFAPHIAVVNNVDVRVNSEAADIRSALQRQLFQPVRWVETIRHMVEQGIESVAECGPGKVLTGLNKRIVKGKQYVSLENPDTFDEYLREFAE